MDLRHLPFQALSSAEAQAMVRHMDKLIAGEYKRGVVEAHRAINGTLRANNKCIAFIPDLKPENTT